MFTLSLGRRRFSLYFFLSSVRFCILFYTHTHHALYLSNVDYCIRLDRERRLCSLCGYMSTFCPTKGLKRSELINADAADYSRVVSV